MLINSCDTRDYTKEPINIMDILELYAFKQKMDALNASKELTWLPTLEKRQLEHSKI